MHRKDRNCGETGTVLSQNEVDVKGGEMKLTLHVTGLFYVVVSRWPYKPFIHRSLPVLILEEQGEVAKPDGMTVCQTVLHSMLLHHPLRA